MPLAHPQNSNFSQFINYKLHSIFQLENSRVQRISAQDGNSKKKNGKTPGILGNNPGHLPNTNLEGIIYRFGISQIWQKTPIPYDKVFTGRHTHEGNPKWHSAISMPNAAGIFRKPTSSNATKSVAITSTGDFQLQLIQRDQGLELKLDLTIGEPKYTMHVVEMIYIYNREIAASSFIL